MNNACNEALLKPDMGKGLDALTLSKEFICDYDIFEFQRLFKSINACFSIIERIQDLNIAIKVQYSDRAIKV